MSTAMGDSFVGCPTALQPQSLLPGPAVPQGCQVYTDPSSQLCTLSRLNAPEFPDVTHLKSHDLPGRIRKDIVLVDFVLALEDLSM